MFLWRQTQTPSILMPNVDVVGIGPQMAIFLQKLPCTYTNAGIQERRIASLGRWRGGKRSAAAGGLRG